MDRRIVSSGTPRPGFPLGKTLTWAGVGSVKGLLRPIFSCVLNFQPTLGGIYVLFFLAVFHDRILGPVQNRVNWALGMIDLPFLDFFVFHNILALRHRHSIRSIRFILSQTSAFRWIATLHHASPSHARRDSAS